MPAAQITDKGDVNLTELQLEKMLSRVEKPGRYVGGELNSVVKDKSNIDVRFAFCFPDSYEVGMSHLGIKILYSCLNQMENVWCERCFAPWEDMEKQLRENGLPLFALESRDPLCDFDIIGFTMQYELSYTNVLNMLDLANVPIFSKDRSNQQPIVVMGGPCTYNPEPLADFADIISLGEGEEALCELCELYGKHKKSGFDRKKFLFAVATELEGFYVPSLYTVTYKSDGTIAAITPDMGVPAKITKRIVKDLDKTHYPEKFVVPFMEVIHDRAVEEIFRGCIRGCRFCQAGYVYRPIREKSPDVINAQAKSVCDKCGYEELSLCSLSTSDYKQLPKLLEDMLDWTQKDKVNISLPSLRVDNFPEQLMRRIQSVRKSGLTFAPEAGTQRLRDVINKNITEDAVINTAKTAFSGGNTSVKLYFMLGLPTETLEDVSGIGNLAQKVVDTFYSMPNKPKGKGVTVSVSCAAFVPKPFTPFQWEPQDDIETIKAKQKHLVENARSRKIRLSWSDPETSFLEAVLARGDRRVCPVIYEAFKMGCKFDSWGEYFHFDVWMSAFEKCSVDPKFFANRRREYTEVLPWSHIDIGIPEGHFMNESIKAKNAVTTQNCREKCNGCGANKLLGRACD